MPLGRHGDGAGNRSAERLRVGCLAAMPHSIVSSVLRDPLYGSFAYVWPVTAGLLFLVGVIAALRRSVIVAVAASLIAFLNVGATVMVRDGIRDFTLRAAGFEVWNRQ